MKQKIWSIIFTLLLALSLLTGCASRQGTNTGKKEGYMYGVMGGCTAAGGVYVGGDALLHYYDKETASDVILCHKPDCRHEAYDSARNPDPVCDAALNKDLSMKCIPFMDGEYIYLFGDKDVGRGVIYRERADGSEREQLAVTEYQCLENANGYIKGNKAYLVGNQPVVTEDPVGGVGSNKCYYVLLEVDLTDGTCTPRSEIKPYDFQGMFLLGTSGEELYYYFTYRENSADGENSPDRENPPDRGNGGDLDELAEAEDICDIYALNLNTGEVSLKLADEKGKGYSPQGMHEGMLLLEKSGEAGKWYQCRLEDGSITAAEEEFSLPGTCFDQWVVYWDEESMVMAEWEDVEQKNGKKLLSKPLGGVSEE